MEVDLLVRGGAVIDGSGSSAFPADVAVRDGRIIAIEPVLDVAAAEVIDARSRVVAPGFIDTHVHSEVALRGGPDRYGSVLQGVTSHVTAPDGFGWAGLPGAEADELWRSTLFASGHADADHVWPTPTAYLAAFEGVLPVNLIPMAPHQAIRLAVTGWEPRPAEAVELEAMCQITEAWLDAGAFGLNTGLDYAPAAHSSADELVALGRVVRARGGVLAGHLRYGTAGRVGAWREAIHVAREADVPFRISHETVDEETTVLLERMTDVDVTIDGYLYPAGSTHLLSVLPLGDQAGGIDATVRRLQDRDTRSRVARAIDQAGPSTATAAKAYFSASRSGRYIGRTLGDIAADRRTSIGETIVDLIIDESPDGVLVFPWASDADAFEPFARATVRHPAFSVASDGIYHGELPHPRGYGAFARVLRWLVRELGALTLEEAIHRMTWAPAERFGVRDRGRIVAGAAGDLVVFDPLTIADQATWTSPRAAPLGIDAVIVNGSAVVRDGHPTGQLPGRVLRSDERRSALLH